MRVSHVEIRNVRSLFPDSQDHAFSLSLAEGMNTLVGRNNCGKSNVLRAITLALDPNCALDPSLDLPGARTYVSPEITVRFETGENPAEQALLDRYHRWRVGAGPGNTPSGWGGREIGLRVTFTRRPDGGYDRIVALLPAGAHPTAAELHDEIVADLFQTIQVVVVSSGQGLEAFLEGNFRAVLHTVLSEHLHEEVEAANRSREEYIAGLEGRLLEPLRMLLGERLQRLFAEIGDLALHPDVPSLEQTLARVAVSVTDAVETPLAAKGTGVRGGVLVALLSYLADNSQRALVFLVEEPEAFLHPAAQEDLRDTLELIAGRDDVTSVVTTHSPFIASRDPKGQVVALAKDREGRTRIEAAAPGDSDHAHLIGGLLRPSTFEYVLRSSMAVPADKRAVLMVEGPGDRFCLELAAQRAGRPELVADLDIRPAGGTVMMIVQAVVAREALKGTDVSFAVLLDADQAGVDAAKTLKSQKFKFQANDLISYGEILRSSKQDQFPYEAEDLWPPELLQRFVDQHGATVWAAQHRRPDGEIHYDFDQPAKERLGDFFRAEVTAEHTGKWIELLELARTRLGLDIPAALDAPDLPVVDSDQSATVADGAALVVSGTEHRNEFSRWGVTIVPTDLELPEGLTHTAFYVDGAIQPVVPAVRSVFRHLTFAAEVADDLRSSGGDAARIGDLMVELLELGAVGSGEVRHVLLLSSEDANDTLHLTTPIENTKTIRGGRAVAWMLGSTVVPLAALRAGLSTTTELDELIAEHQGRHS